MMSLTLFGIYYLFDCTEQPGTATSFNSSTEELNFLTFFSRFIEVSNPSIVLNKFFFQIFHDLTTDEVIDTFVGLKVKSQK